MPARARSTPSGDEDVKPLELCKEDRRKLYGLLDADAPARLRRIELGGIALTVAVASPKIGGPSVAQLTGAVIQLFH